MRDVALSIDINHPRCGLSKFLRSKNMREEIINCELNLEYILSLWNINRALIHERKAK